MNFVEWLFSEVIIHQSALGSFELVPSSNPYSQDSLDDSILLRLCNEEGPENGLETFEKEVWDNMAGCTFNNSIA